MKEPLEQWMEELLNQDTETNKLTAKQAKILEAAIELFAQKGYASSSTSEIAQKAGVAEGTIFRHYKTKKDLLFAIVAPAMARLIAPFVLRDFKKVLDLKYESYDQFLRAFIENRIDFLERNMSLFRILVQEIPFHPELQEQFKKVVVSQVFRRMKEIVIHFQRQGQLIQLPSETAVRLSVSAIFGYVLVRTLHGVKENSGWDDAREREETIRFIMRGLRPEQA